MAMELVIYDIKDVKKQFKFNITEIKAEEVSLYDYYKRYPSDILGCFICGKRLETKLTVISVAKAYKKSVTLKNTS